MMLRPVDGSVPGLLIVHPPREKNDVQEISIRTSVTARMVDLWHVTSSPPSISTIYIYTLYHNINR